MLNSIFISYSNVLLYLETNRADLLHGGPQNIFLGWANYFLDRAKGNFNTCHSKILIQISYFVHKILQMSNSWTGQVPSLAHWCGRPCSSQKPNHHNQVKLVTETHSKCRSYFLQIFDYEHKEDFESGENKLFVLLERGECDLETIVEKLVTIQSNTITLVIYKDVSHYV